MVHVTFETAKRLGASGFPQPKLNHLQLWTARRYPDGTARHDALLIVTVNNKLIPFDGGNYVDCDENRRVFMPTATDILKDNPGWFIFFSNFSMPNGDQKKMWSCRINCDYDENEFYHENPAECAAMAWLQVHENK